MDDSLEALLGRLSTAISLFRSGADRTGVSAKGCLLLPTYREGHEPQEHV